MHFCPNGERDSADDKKIERRFIENVNENIMKFKKYILLAVLLSVVLLQVGCNGTTRTQVAHRRFDRVMEQARIDAALESIERGRLQYAIRLLEDLVESGSAFAPQAEEILKDLRLATQQMAIARDADAVADRVVRLN